MHELFCRKGGLFRFGTDAGAGITAHGELEWILPIFNSGDKLAQMPANHRGSIHLFQIAGIDVYLHWSWFIIAIIEVAYLRTRYTSLVWCALEYLALFVIVLLHEFGHALACRQVGGTASQIMLWPLGGVAFVDPPQRPGAMLWSIAAGPLVNVALLLPLGAAYLLVASRGWPEPSPDPYTWLIWVFWINVGLLVFNILPIYPLDGGQILRSLLWFVMGRGRSLQVSTLIGFVGAGAIICLSILKLKHSTWPLAIAAYMLLSCWNGWKVARMLVRAEKMPVREGFACPNCRAKPPVGPHWRCAQCQKPFDTFETGAVCPWCNAQFPATMCVNCQKTSPMQDWRAAESVHAVSLTRGGSIEQRMVSP
jgi:Zn-dependent protease